MAIKSLIGATCACLAVVSISGNAALIATTTVNTGGGVCDFEIAGESVVDASASSQCVIQNTSSIQIDDGSGGQISFNATMALIASSQRAWTIGITSPNYTGSRALFSNQDNGNTTIGVSMGISDIQETITNPPSERLITRVRDTSFDFLSIDVSELLNATSQITPITFYGQQLGGGLVSSTVALDGVFGLETFLFGDIFRGVTSITWAQEADYHQFDNIVFDNVMGTVDFSVQTIVPIPSAVWLFGSGIIGLIGIARRKA